MPARRASLEMSAGQLDWLRAHPSWNDRPVLDRAALTWRARWGSLNARLSRAVTNGDSESTLQDPLLIVGPWRSGTTAMHNLLAAASGYPTPQTWQCMNSSTFALRGTPPATGRQATRPMDGMTVAATSPQEDEFALLGLGCPSHYQAFLAPERIEEMMPMLQQSYWLDDPAWLSTWEWFLRAVLRSAPAEKQQLPLLLKSPNHTFRLQAILRRFPASRVIWMARDASEVFHSNRKMWTEMFRLYGAPATCPAAALDAFLASALNESARALEWCSRNLDPSQLVVIPQSQLAADEAVVMCVLREQWGQDWTGSYPAGPGVHQGTHSRPGPASSNGIPQAATAAIAALNAAQADAMATRVPLALR